jgi:hypothetical protein
MEIYMFGDAPKGVKDVASEIAFDFNIHLLEFCTYGRDNQHIFLFDITLNVHVCSFEKDIVISYTNDEYRDECTLIWTSNSLFLYLLQSNTLI